MYQLVKNILKYCFRRIQKRIKLKLSIEITLSHNGEVGETLFNVKEETLEKVTFLKVSDHIENGSIFYKFFPISLFKYRDVVLFPTSDYLLLNNMAVWPKSKYSHFTKIIPQDKNLIKYTDSTIFIQKPYRTIEINNGFSLCGVHSTIWAHFLVQYLPKINYLQDIVTSINEEITIILPEYKDTQIKEIINKLLKSIKRLAVLELKDNESVRCKNLFYIENTAIISDHSSNVTPSDVIIPRFVLSFLKEKFVSNPLLFPSANIRKYQYRKLYIKRDGVRNIINAKEIEQYFSEEGFEFIYPHKYSLDEKRNLFNEAEIITGPVSSGFTNIIFCQPDTKVLLFTNFQRIYDLYLPTMADYFNVNLFALTGADTCPSDINSSYYIPLKKIINTYKSITS